MLKIALRNSFRREFEKLYKSEAKLEKEALFRNS